jgi:hypothetical protein
VSPQPSLQDGAGAIARVMALQRAAGNRATAAALSEVTVQRVPVQAEVEALFGAHLREATRSGNSLILSKSEKKLGSELEEGDTLEVDFDVKSADRKWVWAIVKGITSVVEGAIRRSKVKPAKADKPKDAKQEAKKKARGGVLKGAQELVGVADEATFNALDVSTDLFGNKLEGEAKAAVGANDFQTGVDKWEQKKDLEEQRANLGAAVSYADLVGGILGTVTAVKEYLASEKTAKQSLKAVGEISSGVLLTTAGVTEVMATHMVSSDREAKPTSMDELKGQIDAPEETPAPITTIAGTSFTFSEAFDGVKELVLTVKRAYDAFNERKTTGSEAKGHQALEIIEGILKGVAKAVGVAKHFIEVLGKTPAEELVRAIPGLGIVINAATIAIKVFESIFAWIRRAKMRIEKRKWKKEAIEGQPEEVERSILGIKYTSRQGLPLVVYLKTKYEEELKKPYSDDYKKGITAKLAAIENYLLAKEMQTIQEKRLTRSGIKIGLEVTKVAGEIATLSGFGAVGGVPVKYAAGGVEFLMSAVRGVKQFGREMEWWGKGEGKTRAEKEQRRDLHAKRIMAMIANVATGKDDAEKHGLYEKAAVYIEAAGADAKSIFSQKSAEKVKQLLVDAMKER